MATRAPRTCKTVGMRLPALKSPAPIQRKPKRFGNIGLIRPERKQNGERRRAVGDGGLPTCCLIRGLADTVSGKAGGCQPDRGLRLRRGEDLSLRPTKRLGRRKSEITGTAAKCAAALTPWVGR